jgi:dTDP-4-dehydrorhamnose reductase
MKILVTGSNGLLGQKLVKQLSEDDDIVLIATARGLNRNPAGKYIYESLDITSRDEVARCIQQHKPGAIINTAAMTQVDACEEEKEVCWDLNVNSVKYLIEGAAVTDSFLVHLSTDFVFDGAHGPYKEDDQPNPLSYYAESKLASERLLQSSNVKHAIIRTMLVYGIAHDMSRSNIILWVKKNLEEGKPIRVVNDQWRMPTLAEDLAKGCVLTAKKRKEGLFHMSGKDMLTPYEMAIATADYFGLDKSLIEEVDGSIFTQPAKRPPRTGFILDKAMTVLNYDPVSFERGIAILDEQIKNQ